MKPSEIEKPNFLETIYEADENSTSEVLALSRKLKNQNAKLLEFKNF